MPENEYSVGLGLVLDTSTINSIKQQIKAIEVEPIPIKLDTSQIKTQISNLKKEIVSLGNIKFASNNSKGILDVGNNSGVKSTTIAYKELLAIGKQISSMQLNITKLSSAGGNDKQVALLTDRLKILEETYLSLRTTFQSDFDVGQMANLTTQIAQAQEKMRLFETQILDTKTQLATAFSQSVSNGSINSELTTIESKVNSLDNASYKLKSSLTALRNIENEISSGKLGVDELIAKRTQYNDLIKITNNLLKTELTQQRDIKKEAELATKVRNESSALSNQMDIWLKNNSAAAGQFGARIKVLQNELKSCDSVRLSGIKNEFKQITQEATLAGKNVKTFGDQVKTKISSLESYFSGMMIITYALQGLRNMYDTVLDIDTAMTELKKVTDDTNAAYDKFLNNAPKNAKEVSATISEYIQTASDYARLGYNTEQSSDLAKTALLYNNVGDEIQNVDQATSSLISTMNGFHIAAQNSLQIVDKFNNVGKLIAQ